LLSPLLEPSLLFFLLSVRSLLGAVAVTPPQKKKMPISYKYMFLNLPRDVIRSIACFRLHIHNPRFETMIWNQSNSPICDLCDADDIQDEQNVNYYCVFSMWFLSAETSISVSADRSPRYVSFSSKLFLLLPWITAFSKASDHTSWLKAILVKPRKPLDDQPSAEETIDFGNL
jgi:hypothetical protein